MSSSNSVTPDLSHQQKQSALLQKEVLGMQKDITVLHKMLDKNIASLLSHNDSFDENISKRYHSISCSGHF